MVDDLSEDAEKNEHEGNDDGSWCYCKQPRGGDMVGCENPSCKITWHACVLTKYLKENGPVPVPTFIILKNVPNEMIILSD